MGRVDKELAIYDLVRARKRIETDGGERIGVSEIGDVLEDVGTMALYLMEPLMAKEEGCVAREMIEVGKESRLTCGLKSDGNEEFPYLEMELKNVSRRPSVVYWLGRRAGSERAELPVWWVSGVEFPRYRDIEWDVRQLTGFNGKSVTDDNLLFVLSPVWDLVGGYMRLSDLELDGFLPTAGENGKKAKQVMKARINRDGKFECWQERIESVGWSEKNKGGWRGTDVFAGSYLQDDKPRAGLLAKILNRVVPYVDYVMKTRDWFARMAAEAVYYEEMIGARYRGNSSWEMNVRPRRERLMGGTLPRVGWRRG